MVAVERLGELFGLVPETLECVTSAFESCSAYATLS